jgi:hypothetical protein
MNQDLTSNEADAVAKRLYYDSQRIVPPPFDPLLHQSVLARIRPRSQSRILRRAGLWVLATAAALAIGLNLPKPPTPPGQAMPTTMRKTEPLPGSWLAYTIDLHQSEDALLATLDREARRSLPSSNPFNPAEEHL